MKKLTILLMSLLTIAASAQTKSETMAQNESTPVKGIGKDHYEASKIVVEKLKLTQKWDKGFCKI